MSRSIDSALGAHFGGTVLTLAECVRIKRTDDVEIGFTTHDADITFDGLTYHAVNSIDATAIRQSADLAVDNMEIMCVLDSDYLDENDLRAKRYDHAEMWIFIVNWADLTMNELKLAYGRLGEVKLGEGHAQVEFRGLSSLLQQVVGDVYGSDCGNALGDSGCMIDLDPDEWQASTAYVARPQYDARTGDVVKPTTDLDRFFECVTAGTSGGTEPSWDTTIGNQTSDGTAVWEAIRAYTKTVTIASVVDNRQFTVSTAAYPDDWFTYGTVEVTSSGDNNGIQRKVKSFTQGSAESTVELWEVFPFDLGAGDELELVVGCDKLKATCQSKFDNIYNFDGYPFIPGTDKMLEYPDAQ